MRPRRALAVALLSLAASCRSPAPAFDARLQVIEKRVVDLTALGGLFGSKEFVEVYRDPAPHAAEALKYAAGTGSETRKLIAVYAMQGLPLDEHLTFLERLLEERKAGRVSEQVFEHAAFPAMEWNTLLQEEYKDPDVVAFLKKARPAVSARMAGYIDRILSGRAADDVDEMRAAGQIPGITYVRHEWERNGARVVWNGDGSAVTRESFERARTPEEWAALWKRHAPRRKRPAVDFSKEMVVALFSGSVGPGFEAPPRLEAVRQEPGELVLEFRAGSSDAEDQGSHSWYTIAVVPKSGKRLVATRQTVTMDGLGPVVRWKTLE